MRTKKGNLTLNSPLLIQHVVGLKIENNIEICDIYAINIGIFK